MVTCFDLEDFAVPDTHPNFQYMVYQTESAPTTGQWHIQGYLVLKRIVPQTAVLHMFPCQVHLDVARGTQAQCIAYCTKAETRVADPIEFGEKPEQRQGQRLDLEVAAQAIRAHTSWDDVVNDPALYQFLARYGKWVETIYHAKALAAPVPDLTLRRWQTRVIQLLDAPPVKRQIIWIWSQSSGTGKTTFFDYCSTKYKVLPGSDWTNTIYLFDGHAIVWFDRTRAESDNEKNVDEFYRDLERWSNHTIHNSTKYVPCRKLAVCHVVVTANSRPIEARLPGRFIEIVAYTAEEEHAQDVEEMETEEEVVEADLMELDQPLDDMHVVK